MIYRPVIQPVYRPLIRSVLRPRRDGDDFAFDLDSSSGEMRVARGGVVPSFSRASQATRDTPTLVEAVAAGLPAVDWSGGRWRGRFESQGETVYSYHAIIPSAGWGANGGATLTYNDAMSPEGVANAVRLTRTITGSALMTRTTVAKPSSTVLPYTMSIFAKRGTLRYASMRAQGTYPSRADLIYDFDTDTVTTSSATFTDVVGSRILYPDGWVRLILSFRTDTSAGIQSYVSVNDSPNQADGNSMGLGYGWFWGAMLTPQLGNSSLIFANGFTMTRQADQLSIPTAGWLPDEGTLLVKCGVYPGSITTGPRTVFSVGGGGNHRLRIDFASGTGPGDRPIAFVGNGTTLSNAAFSGAAAEVEWMALSFSPTRGCYFFRRVGGVMQVSANIGNWTGIKDPTLWIASGSGGATLNGYIDQIRCTRYLGNDTAAIAAEFARMS